MDSILERIDNNYKEIKKFRPFEDKNLLKQIRDFYRVEVTWSSNAIEGSSYTLSETKVLLEDGLTAGGKPLSHALAAKSHAEAWNYMFSVSIQSPLCQPPLPAGGGETFRRQFA